MKAISFQLILIAVATLYGCNSSNQSSATIEKFQVINPYTIDTTYYKEYVATIESVRNVEIRARVEGQLQKIHVDEGQKVKEGQLLFTIGNYGYKEELAKAGAALKNAIAMAKAAEVELLNTRSLVNQNVISETELAIAESKLESAKALIEEARSNEAIARLKLTLTEVRAPFDGIIDRIPLKAGSLIEEGTLLTKLSDNKEVFAYFNVSESEYLDIVESQQQGSERMEATLKLANSKDHPHKGKVEVIQGEFDKSTGTISFRARFPNPGQILKHGSSGKILLANKINNALVIPQKSTFEIQNKVFVYTIDSANVVQMRSIEPKLRLPHLFVIQKGLSETDNVLYEGIQMVKEGDKIVPEFLSGQSVISQLDIQ
ncbi:MAG TPA: efflux RND transporter periplasmic adaptor subunit [Cytophagaceae bacterium]